MTSDFKDDSLKLKDAEWLEQYLAGKAPLHAEGLHLPSAEELNAAEAAFDEIVAGRQKTARRVPLWAWAAAVAAVLMVAVLLWPKPEAQQPPALMANEAAKAQRSEDVVTKEMPKPEDKNLVAMAEGESEHKHEGESKRQHDGESMRQLEGERKRKLMPGQPKAEEVAVRQDAPASIPSAISEPKNDVVLAEAAEEPEEQEPSLIPADKQALADLYLAEEALQVAYERRAQVEAIRAYAASIKGEKLPKPVIAF